MTARVSDILAGSGSTIHVDGATLLARELSGDGATIAGWLREGGLEPGDRVAVWAANGRGYLLALAAAAAGRFVVVSINTRFSPDEAWSIIERSGARVLVTDQALERNPGGVRVISATDLVRYVDAAPPVDEGGAGDPFIVFTTSGTTSKPKLVLHRQSSIAEHGIEVASTFPYRADDRVMIALPLCGVFGLTGFVAAVAGGSEIWLPPKFDAADVAATIESVAITSMNGSDDMFHRLLSTRRDLSSIRQGGYGAFNPSLGDVVERADQAGVALAGLYGMSEVQAQFSFRHPSDPIGERTRAGGRLASGRSAARVVDPDSGNPMPAGEAGELQLRGPSLFAGYLAEGGAAIDDELTGRAFVTDGEGDRWFCTGDLARMEADGGFEFLTRMGDVLRLGGFLVSPAEIEEAVLDSPAITEVQAVAVNRPGGARPVAVVTASGPVDEQAVIDHCATRLARFKVPVRVVVVDDFPTTPSANGTKIQRNKLVAIAEQALG